MRDSFHLFEDVTDKSKLRVFNMDESGLTSVQKQGTVLSVKGEKQVSGLTSGERGSTTAIVCCVSSAGQYVPPMMIFRRIRMAPVLGDGTQLLTSERRYVSASTCALEVTLLDGSPPDTVGYANKSGWINAELFEYWLDHFIAAVQPSRRASTVLLIMYGHSSHTKRIQGQVKQYHHYITTTGALESASSSNTAYIYCIRCSNLTRQMELCFVEHICNTERFATLLTYALYVARI